MNAQPTPHDVLTSKIEPLPHRETAEDSIDIGRRVLQGHDKPMGASSAFALAQAHALIAIHDEVRRIADTLTSATGGRPATEARQEPETAPVDGGGSCPPTAGGGYDCTCEGNPRCEKSDRAPADGACPACEGSSRETVGMVCQTCGEDYAVEALGADEMARILEAADERTATWLGMAREVKDRLSLERLWTRVHGAEMRAEKAEAERDDLLAEVDRLQAAIEDARIYCSRAKFCVNPPSSP